MRVTKFCSYLLTLWALSLTSGCCTIGGALLGGGAGTVVGGGAGLCCGKPAEGAAKGAAVGGATGAVAGVVCDAVILSPFMIVSKVLGCDKSDGAVASEEGMISPENGAMTPEDIVALVNAGVDNQTIVNQIAKVGMEHTLASDEILFMVREAHVSQAVISAAQGYPELAQTQLAQNEAGGHEVSQPVASEQIASPEIAPQEAAVPAISTFFE